MVWPRNDESILHQGRLIGGAEVVLYDVACRLDHLLHAAEQRLGQTHILEVHEQVHHHFEGSRSLVVHTQVKCRLPIFVWKQHDQRHFDFVVANSALLSFGLELVVDHLDHIHIIVEVMKE